MSGFMIFFRSFLDRAFRNRLSWLFHFAVPPAAFLAMFLLLRSAGSDSFASSQALGLVVYFTMIQAVMAVSLAMRDKEEGVYARICVSPLPRAAYAAGNGAAALLILSAQVALSAAFVLVAFPASLGLGYLQLLPVLLAFASASVGFAFLVCSLSSTRSGAMIAANVAVMFSSLLSGGFFPVEFMNPFLRKLAFAFPQFWAMRAIRQAQAQAPFPDQALSILIVLLFGFLFFALAAALRKREA